MTSALLSTAIGTPIAPATSARPACTSTPSSTTTWLAAHGKTTCCRTAIRSGNPFSCRGQPTPRKVTATCSAYRAPWPRQPQRPGIPGREQRVGRAGGVRGTAAPDSVRVPRQLATQRLSTASRTLGMAGSGEPDVLGAAVGGHASRVKALLLAAHAQSRAGVGLGPDTDLTALQLASLHDEEVATALREGGTSCDLHSACALGAGR